MPHHHRLVEAPPVKTAYLTTTRVLSGVLIVVGLAMIVSALARGGGGLAVGVVLGSSFALLGAARLWLARGGDAR
jgi:hypothetical protein